jgi:hypothetical protein
VTEPDVEWFESWFGEDYVALYPHRNEAEAERAVALIANAIGDRPVKLALDLACGSAVMHATSAAGGGHQGGSL